MNNISIGQYVPLDSWIYKMDPRMKIIITFLTMILIFIIPTMEMMLVALALFIILFLSTKIPPLKVIKGLKSVLFLLLFTFILQVIYNDSGTLWATIDFHFGVYQALAIIGIITFYILTKKYLRLGILYTILMLASCFVVQHYMDFEVLTFVTYKLNIYSDGVSKGVFIFVRIVLMIGITSLLTFSTSNTEINNGIASVLSPLKVVKFPVGVVSMTLSLTLRFIPTLIEETQKIMKAQSSRGVDFSEGNLKEKVNQIISLLIPMFVISFKKAEDLANAMEARGYVIDAPRTKYDELKLKVIDFVSLFIVIGLFITVVVLKYAL